MTLPPGREPRDERIETNPDADLAEVLRDDALLDTIGASRELELATLPDDDVTRMLTAWQADAVTYADHRTQPAVEVPSTSVPERPAADRIATRRHARPRRGGRMVPRSAAAISAAAVAGVVLSVGGVAAAVTGSPLTPLKAVVSGLAPASEQDGAAAITSVMPRELASVRTDIREGHLDEARRKLTDVRERAEELGPGSDQANAFVVIGALEKQIDNLEQATPSATTSPSPSTSPTESATPTPTPTPTVTSSATPSPTVEPTPTASNGLGLGRARLPGEHPDSPQGDRYDGGPSS